MFLLLSVAFCEKHWIGNTTGMKKKENKKRKRSSGWVGRSKEREREEGHKNNKRVVGTLSMLSGGMRGGETVRERRVGGFSS
jgi:hypothetical protein